MKEYKFNAVIIKNPDMDAAYIEFPYKVKQEFGKMRVKVKVWVDGEEYDGLLCRMGTPNHIIGIRKDIRAKIHKQPGDTVSIKLIERQ